MRKYNPQPNQKEINESIFNSEFFEKQIINIDLNSTNGKNPWLESFLAKFTHQDTFIKDDEIRLQGWFKPLNYEKYNFCTPRMEVECFSPDYGLYVTIYIRK